MLAFNLRRTSTGLALIAALLAGAAAILGRSGKARPSRSISAWPDLAGEFAL